MQDNSPDPGVLHAYDAGDLTNDLYNSNQAGSRDTLDVASKFNIPLVANGKVFVASNGQLTAFGLLPLNYFPAQDSILGSVALEPRQWWNMPGRSRKETRNPLFAKRWLSPHPFDNSLRPRDHTTQFLRNYFGGFFPRRALLPAVCPQAVIHPRQAVCRQSLVTRFGNAQMRQFREQREIGPRR